MAEQLPIQRDESGEFAGIVTVTLEQGDRPVVVLDHDLMQRLETTLRALPHETRGLVLRSASERSFVAGADLKSIMALDDDQLMRYLEFGSLAFGMLCAMPCPTVAAIGGAALGGGLELAMHCDALVGGPSASGKPYPVGLPECGLGICPGWGGTNLLPARMSDAKEAISRVASGTPMSFEEAADAGVFDEVVGSAEEIVPAAKRWILKQEGAVERDGAPSTWIGRMGHTARAISALDEVRGELPSTQAAAAVADAIDVGIARGWKSACAAERGHLVRLRHTPEAKAAIEAFFNKSKK